MKLSPPTSAPRFSTVDLTGNPISLDDYRGKHLLLSFYRYASCPFCNMRLHELLQKHDEYKAKGLNFLAIFESTVNSIHKYLDKHNVPFPIIPDPDLVLYNLYGLRASRWGYIKGGLMNLGRLRQAEKLGFEPGEQENEINMLPADFIIDPEQMVRQAFYAPDIVQHMPFSTIDKYVAGINA